MSTLNEWLRTVEWYDNHKLSTILNCLRKAWLHTEFRGGLAGSVGNGAFFGSCVHAGLAAYNASWGQPENTRRLRAIRAFASEHARKFGPEPSLIDKKHTIDHGMNLLDEYFDRFLMEDRQWRPIETELACIVPIAPTPDDPPFSPFYFVFRVDGLWERVSNGDWFVEETKTTGGNVARELTRLMINRQGTGYVWGMRQFDKGHRIVGVLYNVLFVGSSFDFGRDIRMKDINTLESWRSQTIAIVEDWRRKLRAIDEGASPLTTMYQNDQMCTHYGKCPYFDVCYHGLPLAETLPLNTWTPFTVTEEAAY